MCNAGIIAEYNPFHTGHAYQIQQTRAQLGDACGIVVVMSGNWVQQADCAITDKWARARMALSGGADLVLELPTVWAVSSAEAFARGGIRLLQASGVVDTLSFGSECGNTQALEQVAQALDRPDYPDRLAAFLDQGLSFPAARQAAVRDLIGDPAALLDHPNNNLGVEYLRALRSLNSSIRPLSILRSGAMHNTWSQQAPYRSGTQLRSMLRDGQADQAAAFLLPGSDALLTSPACLNRIEPALLARVRTMTAQDWACLPDSGAAEGLPRRLERAGQQCADMESFFTLSKTRRYPHARLRRLALWAMLGLTASDRPEYPPYLRVLGFNRRGQELLKEMKHTASLPILTKPAHAKSLDKEGQRLFTLESRCTDLYGLCFPSVRPGGLEWTTDPVRVD